MAGMKYARAEELLDTDGAQYANQALDPTPLLGSWLNTNSASSGMAKVVLGTHEGALTVRVFGADKPAPRDWGEVTGEVYAKSFDSQEGTAFSALYDFGFMESQLQANVKQGVLVIASFVQFKDDSGRANYFVREFYYQE